MSRSTISMFGAGLTAGALALLAGVVRNATQRVGLPYEWTIYLPAPLSVPRLGSRTESWLILLVGLVLLVGVVAGLASLAQSSLGKSRGRAALFLASWCACMLGGAVAGLVSVAGMVFRHPDSFSSQGGMMLYQFASIGLMWGLLAGWLVGLVSVAIARRSGNDTDDVLAYPSVPQYPATGDPSDQR